MKRVFAIAGLSCAMLAQTAQAEVQDCMEITSLPAVITTQGVHCLKHDLDTSMTSGVAITINTNNVVLDMNGFKLGGMSAGAGTSATGIFAVDRQNITIRNGTIRGFHRNLALTASAVGSASNGLSKGHVVEDMRIDTGRKIGIMVQGRHSIVRNNLVIDGGNGGSALAWGIYVGDGPGHSVTGNIVDGVAETTSVTGIAVSYASETLVQGNEVRSLSGSSTVGVLVSSSDRVVLKSNIVTNASAGTSGISANGTNDSCLDNVVSNFTTAFSGCELDVRNEGL